MGDEGFTADDDTSYRRAEALAETHAHAVEFFAEIRERACVGGDGFPNPRAVEMEFYAVLAGEGRDGAEFGQRHYHAVEGVFQRDHAGGASVHIRGYDGVGLYVLESEVVVVTGADGDDHCIGKRGHATGFVVVDVASYIAEDRVRRLS